MVHVSRGVVVTTAPGTIIVSETGFGQEDVIGAALMTKSAVLRLMVNVGCVGEFLKRRKRRKDLACSVGGLQGRPEDEQAGADNTVEQWRHQAQVRAKGGQAIL